MGGILLLVAALYGGRFRGLSYFLAEIRICKIACARDGGGDGDAASMAVEELAYSLHSRCFATVEPALVGEGNGRRGE